MDNTPPPPKITITIELACDSLELLRERFCFCQILAFLPVMLKSLIWKKNVYIGQVF